MGPFVSRVVFTPPEPSYLIDHKSFHTIRNPEDLHDIPIVTVTHKKPRMAILYSHGNAEDLGLVHKWCEVLSLKFHASVYSYDYRGYGPQAGSATERNVFSDITAVVEYMKKFHAVEDIVFFGRSLGCAPSIKAASLYPRTKALILESPFLTCVKTVVNTSWTFWFDMFCNEKTIKECHQPTLIIHGTRDTVVPFAHGQRLLELCPNATDHLWLAGAGHNDIDTTFRADLFQKCLQFMENVGPAPTLLRKRPLTSE